MTHASTGWSSDMTDVRDRHHNIDREVKGKSLFIAVFASAGITISGGA